MANLEAQLSFAVVLAIVLSMFGAWLIGYRYRVAVRRLMSATLEGAADAGAPDPELPAPARHEPAPVSAAGNRRAAWRLTLVLIGLSLLMSASVSSIAHTLMFGSGAFSYKRVAVLAVVQAWPVVPVIGLVWRWSRLRIVAVLAAWFALSFGIALWRSITPDPTGVLAYIAIEIGPPMLLIAALYFGDATRAIAPWLFPLVLGFVVASLAGSDLLAYGVERHAGWILPILGAIGATATIALAMVLPWILAWWPLRAAGRGLARAYARKHLSELSMLLAAVWGIALLYEWSRFAQDGPIGAVVLLPLGWIVAAAWIGARLARHARPAPTLLVLRVFQRDAQVQGLFDTVIERWRVSGNTVLIAGTDLIDRTLDADDIFAFLDGSSSAASSAALPTSARASPPSTCGPITTAATASTSAIATTPPGSARWPRWSSAATSC